MTPKIHLLWLSVLIFLAITGCASSSQTSPVADEKAIVTGVAATLNAALTATQRAIPTLSSTESIAPTPEPTMHAPTPTVAPSPTSQAPSTPGVMVAYTKNSDVSLWSPDQGAIRLTDMHDVVSVSISSDGELIAFKRQDAENIALQELWVVNTTGIPDPRQLVSANDLAALVPPDAGSGILGYGVLNFSWRPKTHVLAYNTVVLLEGPGFSPNHDLRLVDADTLQKTTLFEISNGGLFYYAPDGSQIALSNPESISLVSADGSNYRPNVLTFPNVITYSEYEYHPRPIWARDSASLGVAIPPHDPLNDPQPLTSLWLIRSDGSPAVLLGKVPAIPFAWPDQALSPNLEFVGYSSPATGGNPNQRDLHVSQPDGSKDAVYASGESLEFSSWSPDSEHFIYAIQGGANEGLYIGGSSNPPARLASDPHSVRGIHWVDARRFVYLLMKDNQWELHLSNLEAEDLALIDTIPDASPEFDLIP